MGIEPTSESWEASSPKNNSSRVPQCAYLLVRDYSEEQSEDICERRERFTSEFVKRCRGNSGLGRAWDT
jgi:hypothetical protein